MSERATSGAKTMGTRWVGRAAHQAAQSAARSLLADGLGDSTSASRRALDHQPSRCICRSRPWPGAQQKRRRSWSDSCPEARRVGENHAARGGVEAATIRVGDARIGGQCRGFAAASPLDALGTRKRVDVVEEKVPGLQGASRIRRSRAVCERSPSVTFASAMAPSTSC